MRQAAVSAGVKAPAKRRVTQRPEQNLQISIVSLVRHIRPKVICFHVPNAAKRGLVEAAKFREMGTTAGVSDLVFVLEQGGVGFMELKAPTPKRTRISKKPPKDKRTDPQIAFADAVQEWGCLYALVDTLEGAAAILKFWYPSPKFKHPMVVNQVEP